MDDFTEFWKNDKLNNIIPKKSPNPEGWDVPAFLRELISPYIKTSIVDFGCGYGRNTSAFDKTAYTGIDVNPGAIEEANLRNPGYTFRTVNFIDDVPAADVVMAYTVLLHVSDEDISDLVAKLTAHSEYVLVAEILGRKWRRSGNPPVFNREQPEYDAVFSAHGFELEKRVDKPYVHYKNTDISFLLYKKTEIK